MSKTLRRWSSQEDSILQQEVEAQTTANNGTVQDWNIIARKIEGRSNKDCRKRFYNGITEGLKKGSWSTEEDQLLERLVKKYGPTWAVIAREIETRSADQCSKRWQHCLDPELDRSCWSAEDNIALINSVKTHGSAWKDIQTLHFSCRSANNVKNQYSVLKRHDLKVPQGTSPCCATGAENVDDVSQSDTVIPRMPNDSAGLLGHLNSDMESAFDEMTDANHQSSNLEDGFLNPSPESEDPFQPLTPRAQSHVMTLESIHYDFSSFGPQGESRTTIAGRQPSSNQPITADLDHEHPDYHLQNTVPTSLSYPPIYPTEHSSLLLNSPVNTSPGNYGGAHSTDNAFEWPMVFDPGPLQHQHQNLGSRDTNAQSSPMTPKMQTTIRLEGADPSTISAVIRVLIESKAQFQFETH